MLCSKTPSALFIILLLFVTVVAAPVWADQAGAAAAISSAHNTLLSCYSAVKDAEAAGANITLLVDTLNLACSLLSQAEFAYDTNDFDMAFSLADQSQNTMSNLVGEANSLEETAMQQRNQDFLIYVVGSIIGAFVVMVAGFGVWLFLKKKYRKVEAHVSESS